MTARRALRLFGRFLFGVVFAVVTLVVIALVALQTDWGRERVRRQLEARLEAVFSGDVEVGRLEGTVFSRFTATGLVIRDTAGRPAVRARSLEIDYQLLSILRRTFAAHEVVVEGAEILAVEEADGALNLARLVRPAPPPENPWAIEVDHLRVHDARFTLRRAAGTTTTITDLALDAQVRARGATLGLRLDAASATWQERELSATARGTLVRAHGLIAANDVHVTAGTSSVSIPLLVAREGEGAITGSATVHVAETDVRRFAPTAQLGGDIDLTGTIGRTADRGAPLTARLAGRALGGDIELDLRAWPERPEVEARVDVRGIHPPPPAPAGTLDADLVVRARGRTLADLVADLKLDARGQLAGLRITEARVRGSFDRGAFRARLALATPRGEARVLARGERRPDGELRVDDARVSARGDLRRAFAGRRDLAGSVVVELRGRGSARRLVAEGTARAKGLVAGGVRAATAELRVRAAGPPRDLAATARLDARDVWQGDRPLGRVRAEVRAANGARRLDVRLATGGPDVPHAVVGSARVTRRRSVTTFALGDLRVTTRGLSWTGRGGVVALKRDGGVSVDHVALRSEAGSLAVTGDLAGRRRTRAARDAKLHLHLERLDLARVRAALAPDAPVIAGTLTIDAHVSRRGRAVSAEAEARAEGLVVAADAPPIDGTVDVDARPGRIEASARLRERRTGGTVEADLDIDAPRELLDPDGWARVDLDHAIRAGRVVLRGIDLATVGAAIGRADLRGRLDGTISARPGGHTVDATLALRGLAARSVRGLNVDIGGTWGHDALDAKASLALAGAPTAAAAVQARLGVGLHSLTRAGALTAAPVTARVDVRGLDMDRLRRVLGLGVAIGGVLEAKAEISGTLARPQATARARVHRAVLSGVAFHELVADGRLDDAALTATARARQVQGGALDARVRLARGGARDLAAELRATRFDLAVVSALSTRRSDVLAGVGGRLDANLRVRQVGDAPPELAGELHVRDGRFHTEGGARAVDRVQLDARAMTGRLVLERFTARSRTGRIAARGEVRLDGLDPRGFVVDLDVRRLPVNAGRMVVGVDVRGRVTGELEGTLWRLVARLPRVEVRLPKERRAAELQATGPLEDVVYVDRPHRARELGLSVLTGQTQGIPIEEPKVVMTLVLPEGVRVSGPDADVHLRAAVDVIYRGGQMYLDGGVEAMRGFVTLFGRRYELLRANASFDKSAPPDPTLDIRLAHEFREVTVRIDVEGTVREPELRLSSDPAAYDQAQLLGFVLGGSPDEPATGTRPIGQRAIGLASNLLIGQVQSQIQDALPIDVLRVQIGEGTDTRTTRLEVGKWLSDDLFVGYRARINASDRRNLNEATLEYRFARRWHLDAFFGDRGIGGADVIWTRRY